MRIGTFNGDAEVDEVDDEYQEENRQATTDQTTEGIVGQLAYDGEFAKSHHLFAVGATCDDGHADFRQYQQEADFTTDRSTQGDGDFNLDASAHGENTAIGIFPDRYLRCLCTHFTVASRYNNQHQRSFCVET